METIQPKTRAFKYDNLKALLIFLVVFGHFLTPLSKTDFYAKMIYMVIYIFHMPAFIYITGKFSKPSIKKAGFFLSIYLIFQIVHTLFLHLLGNSSISWTIITPRWTLWYLITVGTYYLLAYLIPTRLTNKQKMVGIILTFAIAIVVGFVPFINETLSLSRTIVFLPFFLMGKWSDNKNIDHKSPRKAIPYGVAAIILSFVSMFGSGGNQELLFHRSDYLTSHSTWYFRLLVLITAVLFIKFLLNVIPNKRIPVLTVVGQNTLTIFLCHGFIVKLFHYFVPNFSLLGALFISLSTIAAIMFFQIIITKTKTVLKFKRSNQQ